MRRTLTAVGLMLACTFAMATGKPPAPTPMATADAAASAKANSAAQGIGGNSHAQSGGSMSNDTNLFILPGPIGGSNLPAGFCQTSQYRHWAFSVIIVSISQANGDSATDLECLKLLGELNRLNAQPIPRKPVGLLTAPLPECTAPPRPARTAAARRAPPDCTRPL